MDDINIMSLEERESHIRKREENKLLINVNTSNYCFITMFGCINLDVIFFLLFPIIYFSLKSLLYYLKISL